MLLINKTGLPDKALKAVLYAAKVAVGSVPPELAVRVAWSRHDHGLAYPSGWMRRERLGYQRKPQERAWVAGYVELWMSHTWLDPLRAVETLYETAAHEFRHIRDFNKGLRMTGRKVQRWARRPEERRACHSAARAKRRLEGRSDWQEAVLNLAVALEARGPRTVD